MCGDPSHGCGVSGVTWATKAQVKVSFYLANGLFSQGQPHVSYSAVTSLPVSVSSAASFPARLCSVGESEWELVSHLMFPPSLSGLTGCERSTLSPGWLVLGGTTTTTSPGLKEPEGLA